MSSSALPDTLYLWHLGASEAPMLVGELNLVLNRRGVSLRYADTWLKNGFALSEDLPLSDQEFFPKDKDLAAGETSIHIVPKCTSCSGAWCTTFSSTTRTTTKRTTFFWSARHSNTRSPPLSMCYRWGSHWATRQWQWGRRGLSPASKTRYLPQDSTG